MPSWLKFLYVEQRLLQWLPSDSVTPILLNSQSSVNRLLLNLLWHFDVAIIDEGSDDRQQR